MMDFTPMVALQRDLVLTTLIDVCTIYPATSTGTLNDRGVLVGGTATSAREYASSTSIPCLIGEARAFINDTLKFQTAVTNNYYLVLPHDVTIESTDEVEWLGERYEIRKLIHAGNMGVMTEALIFYNEKSQ